MKNICFLLTLLLLATVSLGCEKKTPKTLDVTCPEYHESLVQEYKTLIRKNYGIEVDLTVENTCGMEECNIQTDILFSDCDTTYHCLNEKGVIAESLELSYFVPVIVLAKNHSAEKLAEQQTLDDVLQSDLKITLALDHPKLKQTAMKLFPNQTDWVVVPFSVPLKDHLVNGKIDALITWDYLAKQDADELRIIEIPPDSENTVTLRVLVLTQCSDIPIYHVFLAMLSSKAGQAILTSHQLPFLMQ